MTDLGATRVVGVDGCKGGWVAVVFDIGHGNDKLTPRFHHSFQQLLDTYTDAGIVCVDVPIGLSEGPHRACDKEARRALLWKNPSVFPAPDPRLLDTTTFEEANGLSRALTGKGVSLPAFGFFPKVAEVNQIMTPDLQRRVFEIHPEVCFWALAGAQPMTFPKRTPEGYEERRALLNKALGIPIWTRDEARGLARPAKPDDILDATVAAWTARRVAAGKAGSLPSIPETDARGLRMEMVY